MEKNINWLSNDLKPVFISKIDQFLRSNGVIFDFFAKNISDLFSAIQDAFIFGLLKGKW